MCLIPLRETGFGKRNPINAGTKMAKVLNIDVSFSTTFRPYKRILNEEN